LKTPKFGLTTLLSPLDYIIESFYSLPGVRTYAMSSKGKTHTNLIKSGASFFSFGKCIFSRLGKEEKSLALLLFISSILSIASAQLRVFRFIQFGVTLPVFLLLFQIIFARKPKNPV
jgi:hypothetical protein